MKKRLIDALKRIVYEEEEKNIEKLLTVLGKLIENPPKKTRVKETKPD